MRKARVTAARACTAWTEIVPPERLCARRPKQFGWLVDAETDKIFVKHQGIAFQPKSAAIIADREPLWFTVNDAGRVSIFEPMRKPASWSEVVRSNPELAPK